MNWPRPVTLSVLLAALPALSSAQAFAQAPPTGAELLEKALRRAATAKGDTEGLRRDLLALTRLYPCTPVHRKAAEALTELPSPLDKLDAEKISAELRTFLSVPGLVALARAHDRAVAAVAFDPDGARFATSSWDNTTKVWKIEGGALKLHATVEGSPSDIAFVDRRTLATGSPASRVVLWDVSGDRPRVQFKLAGHKHRPFALDVARDGKTLASGSLDPVLRIWKLEGEEPEIWAALANENAPSVGVSALSFSGDGKLLAGGSHLGKQSLRVWDLSGSYLDEYSLPTLQARVVRFAPIERSLAFAGDDGDVSVWRMEGTARKELHVLKGHKSATPPPSVSALAFSPTGSTLATSGRDRRLILWDVATGEKRREWQLLDGVRALAFAPDGRHLVAGNDDGTLYVLRLDARKMQ